MMLNTCVMYATDIYSVRIRSVALSEVFFFNIISNPANIYMFKVNNESTRSICEICSKLTIKTPNKVNGAILVSLLLTLNICHTFFWCFHCWL